MRYQHILDRFVVLSREGKGPSMEIMPAASRSPWGIAKLSLPRDVMFSEFACGSNYWMAVEE